VDRHEHFMFFTKSITKNHALFTEDEIRHAVSVLRIGAGSCIRATDGNGRIVTCRLTEDTVNTLEAEIVSCSMADILLPEMHFAIGLPEKDAFEEIVINLSAMGARRIIPIESAYSQNPWWKNWDKHHDRFVRKMITGIKQSHNPFLPELAAPAEFGQVLHDIASSGNFAVIAADMNGSGFSAITEKNPSLKCAACFIGPPGGFSEEEFRSLRSVGCLFVKICDYRLRTELATTVMCGRMSGLYG
jgi:16S rRNA (uracil1498-N3)-methyltransferase